jgi:phospholipase D1/2
LLDPDFKIERPTRYYRQGLNLLHSTSVEKGKIAVQGDTKAQVQYEHQSSLSSAMGTITSRISRIFRIGHHIHQQSTNGEVAIPHSRAASASSGSSRSSSEPSRAPTPMLDPSTNTNPLEPPSGMSDKRSRAGEEEKRKKKRTGDVSKHTFYVENSQMRLKLFARNEVSSSYFTL